MLTIYADLINNANNPNPLAIAKDFLFTQVVSQNRLKYHGFSNFVEKLPGSDKLTLVDLDKRSIVEALKEILQVAV